MEDSSVPSRMVPELLIVPAATAEPPGTAGVLGAAAGVAGVAGGALEVGSDAVAVGLVPLVTGLEVDADGDELTVVVRSGRLLCVVAGGSPRLRRGVARQPGDGEGHRGQGEEAEEQP